MTTYDSGTAEPLVVGCPVYTADGDEIGHVKEVRGDFFKVDAPMRPDYWLSRQSVDATSGERITLLVDKVHLGDAKVDAPNEHASDAYVPVDAGLGAGASTMAHEGLLTSYPPNAPVAMNELETPVVGSGELGRDQLRQ